MAVTYRDRETTLDRGDVLPKFRWSAIIAGVIAALATQMLMSAIGAAIGMSAAAVAENEDAARGLGIGAGIWFVLSPLVSMSVGGMVAGYLARPHDRTFSWMHGAMVWALSLLIGAFLVGSIATRAVGGLLGAGINAAGTTVGQAADTTRGQREDLNREAREKQAEVQAKIDRNRPEIEKAADRAANVGTGLAWASVLAMVLSLLSAIAGALAMHSHFYGPPREFRTRERRAETGVAPSTPPPAGRLPERDDTIRPDLH